MSSFHVNLGALVVCRISLPFWRQFSAIARYGTVITLIFDTHSDLYPNRVDRFLFAMLNDV